VSKPTVAILRTTPESVLEDYTRLFEMAKWKNFLAKDTTTILKDNISWHMMMPGANTTPWQLEGTIKTLLNEPGYEDLVAVENQTVVTNAFKGDKLNKFDIVYDRYNIPIKYNFKPEDMSWVVYEPKGEMLTLPKIYPEGIRLPDYFFGKNIIHLPTVKTHIYTTTTCSIKNAFGGLLNSKRHYTHSVIHETLVDLLTIQKEIHGGIFAVADGTTCGNGPGPRTLFPVTKDLILASGDCVALDAVAAKIMGFDPMSIDYIRLAHERGLGAGRIDEINVVSEDITDMNFGFTVGDNLASHVGDMLWFGPLKWLQRLAFHTPLVYAFVAGSFVYHDHVWFPTEGRRRVKKWLTTPWGKLFQSY
jgi:uncharacterized protein (DUF362 family)